MIHVQVTYLGHSGFLLEWPACYFLFDWWQGELPSLDGEKPLLVFASHRHSDHFHPAVFQICHPQIRYVLSSDIRLTENRLAQWAVPPEADIVCLRRRSTICLDLAGDTLTLTALPSTDEGVAFVLRYQGKTVYHAGDLHWWHWEGEDPSWNDSIEKTYKKALAPLEGQRVDLAFAPLDPRLGTAYDWGLTYLLETACVSRLFPMHCWDDYGIAARFQAAHPTLAAPLVEVHGPGERWALAL